MPIATLSQTTTFQMNGEPKRIRTEVLLLTSPTPLPLGQTGSRCLLIRVYDDDDDVELNVCLRMSVDMLGTNCAQCVSMVHCCFTSTDWA